MRMIMISEERLDELRDALLKRLECDSHEERGVVGDANVVRYRAVHYEVHSFVDAIKKDTR